MSQVAQAGTSWGYTALGVPNPRGCGAGRNKNILIGTDDRLPRCASC